MKGKWNLVTILLALCALVTSCASTQDSPAPEDLLDKYRPTVRYHTGEPHAAVSFAAMTDDRGTVLRRGSSESIAVPPELSLDFLGAQRYGSGAAVRPGDHLDGARDCGQKSKSVRVRPHDESIVHGHEIEHDGFIWLQYWMFFVCNDAHPGPFGDHAGDVELFQLRVDRRTRQPDFAMYSQHTGFQRKPFADVEKDPNDPNRPVVNVATGTHALYAAAGTWWAPTAVVYDCADGRWESARTTVKRLTNEGWLSWPGRWGATQEGQQLRVSSSPEGPGVRTVWRDPGEMFRMSSTDVPAFSEFAPC